MWVAECPARYPWIFPWAEKVRVLGIRFAISEVCTWPILENLWRDSRMRWGSWLSHGDYSPYLAIRCMKCKGHIAPWPEDDAVSFEAAIRRHPELRQIEGKVCHPCFNREMVEHSLRYKEGT